MRIAIDAVGIREGGGATILQELLHWLPIVRPNWDFHIFLLPEQMRSFDNPGPSPRIRVTFVPLGNSGLGRLLWQNFQLPKLLKRTDVHALLCLANIGSLRPLVPQVVFVQQMLAFDKSILSKQKKTDALKLRVLSLCTRIACRRSSSVIVQTESMRQVLSGIEPRVAQKTAIIPSGVRQVNTSLACATLGKLLDQTTPPRMLYVAHCYPHKNHANLLHALPIVLRYLPTASLLFTADPSAPTSSAENRVMKELIVIIQQLGLADHVHWTGRLSASEVDVALRSCDVAVFPSLAESFGLPLLEAMAARCPVLAADLPYAREVTGDAALYFNPNNSYDIADQIVRIIGDKQLANSLRLKGHSISQRFSYDKAAEQFARVIENAALSFQMSPRDELFHTA